MVRLQSNTHGQSVIHANEVSFRACKHRFEGAAAYHGAAADVAQQRERGPHLAVPLAPNAQGLTLLLVPVVNSDRMPGQGGGDCVQVPCEQHGLRVSLRSGDKAGTGRYSEGRRGGGEEGGGEEWRSGGGPRRSARRRDP